ncbi:class I SAM-dependent methyltransferase [Streptomyces sp. NPDC058701]|uniref:class I SAM-dependent methyltransferase n=1 Tax=Streptomyces sp. NPDC058701 TaxID=3346608 RepID=UPI003662715A
MNENPREDLAINRALWDARARVHGTTPQDTFYDVDTFLAGRQTLFGLEREVAGDVAGLDLLHLHCHFGMDTLSWARLGAKATGVDFSGTAIARARELAARAGLDTAFVEADSQDLPSALAGRFDLVVGTYGVLCWVADLDAWMRGAARALRPGGSLVLVDLHPAYQTVAGLDPFVADWPYGGGDPQRETVTGTYAGPGVPIATYEAFNYPHSLGEIVTAAAGSGLVLERLGEHTAVEFDGRGLLPRDADGLYRLPVSGTHLPVLYSLRARVPMGRTDDGG